MLQCRSHGPKDDQMLTYGYFSPVTIAIHYLFAFTEPASSPGTPQLSDIKKTSLKLTWTVPEEDGGAEITGYHVEYKDQFSTRWAKKTIDTVTETTYEVSVNTLHEGVVMDILFMKI